MSDETTGKGYVLSALMAGAALVSALSTFISVRSNAAAAKQQAEVDAARASMERYRFVMEVWRQNRIDGSKDKEIVAGITRLALTDSEAVALFGPLTASPVLVISQLATEGARQTTVARKRNSQSADDFTALGYQALLRKDLAGAAKNFDRAYAADNFRFEDRSRANLIREYQQRRPPVEPEGVIGDIELHYSLNAPPGMREQLRAISTPWNYRNSGVDSAPP